MSNDDKNTKGGVRSAAPGMPGQNSGTGTHGGKEDWIGRQLRRVFDDALNEPLPDDIMSLLARIDDDATDPTKPRKDGE